MSALVFRERIKQTILVICSQNVMQDSGLTRRQSCRPSRTSRPMPHMDIQSHPA